MSHLIRPLLRPHYLIPFGIGTTGGFLYRQYFGQDSNSRATGLNPHTFTPYTLVSKQPVSSTSSIFTLQPLYDTPPLPGSGGVASEVAKSSIWSIQIKQPQLQIARAYSPIPSTTLPSSEEHHYASLSDIRLLVRAEPKGEMSGYIHALPQNSNVEVRGPHVEYAIPDNVEEILFLAGGTGIAPAMQVASMIVGGRKGRITILWANRRREECTGGKNETNATSTNAKRNWKSMIGLESIQAPEGVDRQEPGLIVQELNRVEMLSTNNGQDLPSMSVQYYVDEEKSFIKPSDVQSRISASPPSAEGKRFVLVSGPDGFVDYWAGKKVWAEGREGQGPLGGELRKMDLRGWKVHKL